MRIKAIEVSPVRKEKEYFVVDFKYSQDGKIKDKKLFSFDQVPYKALKDAQDGQVYDVALEKDKNGYWKWKEVTQVESAAAAATPGTQTRGGSYETPDERARRQISIVRQSSLAQAVAFTTRLDNENDIDVTLAVAERFENWVNRE